MSGLMLFPPSWHGNQFTAAQEAQMDADQAALEATGHRHACDVPGCYGAECYAGRIEGCGHPTKTSGCPWSPVACPGEPAA